MTSGFLFTFLLAKNPGRSAACLESSESLAGDHRKPASLARFGEPEKVGNWCREIISLNTPQGVQSYDYLRWLGSCSWNGTLLNLAALGGNESF
jgi:hypothetical protein